MPCRVLQGKTHRRGGAMCRAFKGILLDIGREWSMQNRLQLRYALAAALTLLSTLPSSARDMLPPGFVYLRDVDSSIQQDIRYATVDNFTGHPLPGYSASECILRREAAEAL